MHRIAKSAGTARLALAVAAALALACGSASQPERAGDLAGAIRAALGEGDALTRQARTATLLESLGREDLPDVLAVYEGMIPSIESWELAAFYTAWGRFDPAGAIEYALSRPRRSLLEERSIGVGAALGAWAQTDPERASTAAEKLAAEHAPLRADIWSHLAAGWVRSPRGTGELAAFLAGIRPRRHRDAAADAAVRELMRIGGAPAVFAFSDGILSDPDQAPGFKSALFESSLRAAAAADPARTGAWEIGHAQQAYASEGCEIVARHWGRIDGAAAMAWLGTHPTDPCRDLGVREAYLTWATADWSGAEAWLESSEPSALLDAAIEVYAGQLLAWEPAKALGSCERVQADERRERCYLAGASRWYAEDAVAAEAWLQTSPLDEAARSTVRKSTGTGGAGRAKRMRRPGAS
jgi:hypothetical protein